MQSQNFTAVLKDAFDKPFEKPETVQKTMKSIALKNDKDVSLKTAYEYLRTPTTDELIKMRQWAIDYKKRNKTESKRQIRKAVQEHFKIRIYR